jgi:hypothetical protein
LTADGAVTVTLPEALALRLFGSVAVTVIE